MRKREVVWEDPRFRKKKDQPKKLKLNRLGEAPCSLPPAHVPQYATASIPSGLTAPPCPPKQAAPPAGRAMPRAAACRRPPPAMSTAPAFQYQQVARPSRPPTVSAPVVVATRPPQHAPQGGARPKQMMYRPGTAIAQRPQPQRPPSPCETPCPPRSGMYSSRPTTARPCSPPPCPQPCPPQPCPPSPTRRPQSPPCPPQESPARFSGLPQRSGLRPPGSGLRPPSSGLRPPGSGLRPPGGGLRPPGGGLRPPTAGRIGIRPPTATVTEATSMIARRQRSPEPCPPSPCPPEPCPPEPCAPDPCPPDPCESRSMMYTVSPPQVSTPQPRRPMAFQGGLRPPSRLMGPGSFSRPQPQTKPQKIVLLPGDINPHETTVITVEPPQQSDTCRPSTAQPSMIWPNLASFDLSPPSMDSYRRETVSCGIAPTPYIPPEVMAMVEEEADVCFESPPETPQIETSSALLVDIEPYNPCSNEPRVMIEPVDLITFPAPDPFSPERACRPPSPSVTPPPNPFTPPKDPIPEPSELDKWAAQYPRYKEAYTSSFHPIGEWAKLKYEQKEKERQVKYVDREIVARSVPFNKNVSTICRDDDYDEDLGLLPCMDFDDNFNAPLDYAALRRQEEMLRQEREARRIERERQEKGPTLAETREMLQRIREAECARRTEMACSVAGGYRPPPMTEEEMRRLHDQIMATHAATTGIQLQQQQPQFSDISCMDAGATFLGDVQLDDIDLDAIDYMDECLD